MIALLKNKVNSCQNYQRITLKRMVRWISLAEAKKATSVFRRRLLRPPWWPRRVSPPWLFRTNGRWTISRMAPGENNGFFLWRVWKCQISTRPSRQNAANDEFLHVFYRDSRDFKMFFASWESLENPVAPPFTLASSKMHSTSVKEQLSPLACQTVGTNRTDSSNNGVVKLWNSSFLQRNWYQQYVMFRLLQT